MELSGDCISNILSIIDSDFFRKDYILFHVEDGKIHVRGLDEAKTAAYEVIFIPVNYSGDDVFETSMFTKDLKNMKDISVKTKKNIILNDGDDGKTLCVIGGVKKTIPKPTSDPYMLKKHRFNFPLKFHLNKNGVGLIDMVLSKEEATSDKDVVISVVGGKVSFNLSDRDRNTSIDLDEECVNGDIIILEDDIRSRFDADMFKKSFRSMASFDDLTIEMGINYPCRLFTSNDAFGAEIIIAPRVSDS